MAVVGLGETTSLSLRGGRALEEIAAELGEIAALCEDEPGGVSTFHLSRELGSNEARCALAIAIMDLDLRRRGEGGRAGPGALQRDAFRREPPDEVAEAAARWRELGFRSFKLKVRPGRRRRPHRRGSRGTRSRGGDPGRRQRHLGSGDRD